MKLVYISHGNIPSQWAHTVQSMKMSQAFAAHIDDFTLLTGIHWSRRYLYPRFDFESSYGITDPFAITRLPVPGFSRKKIFDHVFSEEFSRRAVEWAIQQGADLIYTRTPAALPYCVASGIPFAFESHHVNEDERLELLKAHAKAPNLVAIVTITKYLREKLTRLGLPKEKLFVFPDAVDMDQFDAVDTTASSRFKFPADKFVAGYCGHLYQNRGIEEIIDAAKALPDVHFALAGGWAQDVHSWKQVTAPIPNIQLIGHIDHCQVPAFLRSCNCLLMPYSSSCSTAAAMSPMKMFEYMAADRPIIASDLDSIRTVLSNNENSLLVPPDDGDALAKAIAKLVDDSELRNRLAGKALTDVSQFTWNARAQSILNFISQRQNEPSYRSRGVASSSESVALAG